MAIELIKSWNLRKLKQKKIRKKLLSKHFSVGLCILVRISLSLWWYGVCMCSLCAYVRRIFDYYAWTGSLKINCHHIVSLCIKKNSFVSTNFNLFGQSAVIECIIYIKLFGFCIHFDIDLKYIMHMDNLNFDNFAYKFLKYHHWRRKQNSAYTINLAVSIIIWMLVLALNHYVDVFPSDVF